MTSAVATPIEPVETLTHVLEHPTRFLFFTGKGGVGKTSSAAAVAVALADGGRRVLVVSTDPASNLVEVFAMDEPETSDAVPVPGVPGLDVMSIDPEAAAAAYRERVVGPYRAALPVEAVASIEEELSGSCTVEVAAFNEFVTLLTSESIGAEYDHVIFDTAPTGHTLRLLALPAAWTGFLETNTAGVTCVGPVSALGQTQDSYAEGLAVLGDSDATTVILVARAEASTIDEAARAARELRTLGMDNQRLIVNGVLGEGTGDDTIAVARRAREQAALKNLPADLAAVASVDTVPLLPVAPVGLAGLRGVLHPSRSTAPSAEVSDLVDTDGLSVLVDELVAAGPGVVMTMGKGGVGKTTIAAALAVALADRGLPVTLTTTDPAAHVASVLPDPPAGLEVTSIDPAAETAAWTEHVMSTSGSQLDASARDLLAEDLRSPCTEEVAVFQAFARTVADTAGRYVVIDTAPTGHTLLLLQSSQSFAQQAAGSAAQNDPAATLFSSLRDPQRTHIVLVALPEATPVHEARALQADLARSGLAPWTWVANTTLSATNTTDPVLRARAAQESRWLGEIAEASPHRPIVVPWTADVPVGAAALRTLGA